MINKSFKQWTLDQIEGFIALIIVCVAVFFIEDLVKFVDAVFCYIMG